jgi:hypothetical protein
VLSGQPDVQHVRRNRHHRTENKPSPRNESAAWRQRVRDVLSIVGGPVTGWWDSTTRVARTGEECLRLADKWLPIDIGTMFAEQQAASLARLRLTGLTNASALSRQLRQHLADRMIRRPGQSHQRRPTW